MGKVISFVGDGTRALMHRAVQAAGAPPASAAAALAAFESRYATHLLENTRLYPGIADILANLAVAQVELSILTNKKELYTRRIVEGLGLHDTFLRIVGGDTGWGLKPEPAGLRWILGESDVPPEETWMIGDSGVDIATAVAAGTRSAGVCWGFNAPESLRAAGATVLLETPSGASQLVGLGSRATSRTSPISDAKVNLI